MSLLRLLSNVMVTFARVVLNVIVSRILPAGIPRLICRSRPRIRSIFIHFAVSLSSVQTDIVRHRIRTQEYSREYATR